MEMKWYFIAMAVMFVALYGDLAYSEHTKAECRAAYATSSRSADEISKICE